MKKGQNIICINGDFHPDLRKFFGKLPMKDVVYKVREVRGFNAESGVLLEEIKNKAILLSHYGGYLEPAFSQDRFLVCGMDYVEVDRVEVDIKKKHIIQSN